MNAKVISAEHRFGSAVERYANRLRGPMLLDAKLKAKKGAAKRNSYLRRRSAMPPWVDSAEIRPFFDEAALLTSSTGVPHEVDHIIPLAGVYVSGLHVPWNLRVITRSENRKKCNSFRRFDEQPPA